MDNQPPFSTSCLTSSIVPLHWHLNPLRTELIVHYDLIKTRIPDLHYKRLMDCLLKKMFPMDSPSVISSPKAMRDFRYPFSPLTTWLRSAIISVKSETLKPITIHSNSLLKFITPFRLILTFAFQASPCTIKILSLRESWRRKRKLKFAIKRQNRKGKLLWWLTILKQKGQFWR